MKKNKKKSKLKIYVGRLLAEKGITLLELSKMEGVTLCTNYLSTLINKGVLHPALFVQLSKHLDTTYFKLKEVVSNEDDK